MIQLIVPDQYRWRAAFNPILIHGQRQDWWIEAVSDSSGYALFETYLNKDLELSVGSLFYVTSTNGHSYTGWHTVSSCSTSGVLSETAYGGNGTADLVSDELYTGVRMLVRLYDMRADWEAINDHFVELSYNLDSGFVAHPDLSGVVRSLLSKDDIFPYHGTPLPTVAQADVSMCANYGFRFSFSYLTKAAIMSEPGWSNVHECHGVNAAMQVNEDSNLIWIQAGVSPFNVGKFLTEFEEITVFMGYPNSISFIWNTSGNALKPEDYELFRYQFYGDVDLQTHTLPNQTTLSDDVVRVAIHHGDLDHPAKDGWITIIAETKDSPIEVNDAMERFPLVYDNYECYNNPVYICWMNSLGGFSYWMFHGTQEVKHEVSIKSTRIHPMVDVVSNSQEDVFELMARDKLVIGTGSVTKQQMVALKGLLHSPRIQVLTNADAFLEGGIAAEWLTVSIVGGTFSLGQTRHDRYSIECTLVFPKRNIQEL